ncbi:hypothetical protein AB0B45_44540 [Nonomuraea sp. NPDC049152]|uniref:hypothetical protein n=1 Tax=Nonomuraea sp. NPDC049152 TaxID=3154350 RepID=UPI003405EAAA
MAGLGLLLAVSLAAAFAAESLLGWLLTHTLTGDAAPARWLQTGAGVALGLGVNLLPATSLLSAPPRLRLPLRRLLGPALLITVGLQILNSLGQVYLQLTAANPAYQLVAGAAVMLVYLKAANQLILLATALAATSTTGTITDLATRPTPAEPAPPPRRHPHATAAPSGPHHPLRRPLRPRFRWSRGDK